MTIQQKTYTADEFWDMIDQLDQTRRYELIRGEIVAMPPSSPRNSMIAMRIGRLIGNYVAEYDLGYVMGADGGYTLAADEVRIPDVSFVSKERMPELPDRFEGGPDLAVEVISPSESSRHVMDKIRLYLHAGTRLVWAVYPDEQVVDVYRPAEAGMHVQKVDMDGMLMGDPVLPGFTLDLHDLFS